MIPSLRSITRVVHAVLLASLLCTPLAAQPKRLILKGSLILDENSRPIRLRGGNLKVPDNNMRPADAAADLKNNLKMNLVRLPIEFKYFPPGDPDEDLSTIDANGDLLDIRNYFLDANGYVDYTVGADGEKDAIEFNRLWVDALIAQGIWVQFEARGNDSDTNSDEFYDSTTPSTRFLKFRNFWVAFATAFKNTDYIAGYGMLAEPSSYHSAKSAPDDPVPQPVTLLTTFQKNIMDQIHSTGAGGAGDTWTPFWVGPDYNYNSFQYYYDDYDYLALSYPNRVVYVVNCLTPKPWIDNGQRPDGGAISYPQTPPANNDFSFLLTRTQSEINADNPKWWEFKPIFTARSEETANIPLIYNKEFLTWFLNTYAIPFATAKNVPLVVDQFGASSNAGGSLTYERDLTDLMESSGLHYTRWGYNAGSASRRLDIGTAVHDYYTAIGTRIGNGQFVGFAPTEAGNVSTVRMRAERYTRQVPAPGDTYRWQFDATTGALENRALRAVPVPPNGTGAIAASSAPRMDFRVNFSTNITYPAVYYVWLRLRDGTTTNGAWIGLDGAAGSGQLASATPASWSWVKRLFNSGSPASVTVPSAGFHTFNVWMNQTNVAVDEVVLTTNAALDPNTTLPAYSNHVIDLPPTGSALKPTAPSAVANGTAIALSWTASTGGACTYNVKRATVSGGPYTTVATPTDTRYTNTGLAGGTTYYYVISTVNSSGESPNSLQVSATTAGNTTVNFTSVAAHDGWVLESSESSNSGGSSSATASNATSLRTGDENNDTQYKTIVSFDTSSLPDGATIVSATLKLKRGSLIGTSPFGTHGSCLVDIKNGSGFGGSTALANADFQNAADATSVATLSTPASDGDWSTGGLNATGLAQINKTGHTQLRVYFSLDDNDDGGRDYIGWYSGNNSTAANRPVLEVVYQP